MKVAHKVGVYKEPGAVETILDMPDFDIEVICDGIHVPPVMVHLAYAVKGRDVWHSPPMPSSTRVR